MMYNNIEGEKRKGNKIPVRDDWINFLLLRTSSRTNERTNERGYCTGNVQGPPLSQQGTCGRPIAYRTQRRQRFNGSFDGVATKTTASSARSRGRTVVGGGVGGAAQLQQRSLREFAFPRRGSATIRTRSERRKTTKQKRERIGVSSYRVPAFFFFLLLLFAFCRCCAFSFA